MEANVQKEAIAQKLLNADRACGFSYTRSDELGEDERCYVILYETEVVGFCSFRWVSNQIFYFFITPGWRKKGIGTQALEQLVVALRGRGVEHVVVNMTPGSEPFWFAAFRAFESQQEWGSRYRFNIEKAS